MTDSISWQKITKYSKSNMEYVKEKQKIRRISGFTTGETLYILASAVIKPGITIAIPKEFKNCNNCTGTGIYQKLTKSEYLKIATKVLNWFKKNTTAPNYISWGNEKISVRLAIYAFCKIIAYYDNNNNKLPNTCWFDNKVFATKASQKGQLLRQLEKISNTTIENYRTLYNVFVKHFYYDEYYDDKQTQSQTLSRRKGNCVDLNQLMFHALQEMNYSTRIVRGVVQCRDGQYGHVWAQIRVNGTWKHIDASAAAREKPFGSLICDNLISITNINDAWMVNDTGDM